MTISPHPSQPSERDFEASVRLAREDLVARSVRISRQLAWTTLLFPLLTALGWLFHVELLTRWHPALPAMQPNTALALVLAAFALLLSPSGHPKPVRRVASCSLASVVLLIGLLSLGEYAFGWNLPLDRILVDRISYLQKSFPGRPAPQTSLNFALLGIALLAFNLRLRVVWLAQALSILTGANAIISLTGYIFSTERLYGFPIYTSALGMAINTALGFVFLSVALLCHWPQEGLMTLIVSPTRAGKMARRIFAAGIILPGIVGFLSHLGALGGLYDSSVQISLFVVIMGGLILQITWWAARQAESEELRAREAFSALEKTSNEREIFAALIANSRDFIGIADPSGRPIYVNPAGRRMVGLAPDLPVESTLIPEYYPPEQRRFASEVIVRSMVERGLWEGETFFRNWKTGASIPVSDTHFMIRKPETGEILGMGTITRDITRQKLLEEELRHAQEDQRFLAEAGEALASSLLYENTLTTVAELAVRALADFCIIDVVGLAGEFTRLQVAAHDPSKEWVRDLILKTRIDPLRPSIVQLVFLTKKTSLNRHLRSEDLASIAQSDEHLRTIRALDPKSILSVPLLWQERLIGVITLISSDPACVYGKREIALSEELARRAALAIENARLYRESRRAQLAADSVPALIAYWDSEQRCRFANRSSMKWMGADPAQLLGRTMEEALGPELYPRNLPYIRKALEGRSQEFERDLLDRSTGEIRHTLVRYVPDIAQGRVLGLFVLITDVTELKKARVLAESEREKALAAIKTREEVLAIVSHDLKNPVSAIQVAAELLTHFKPFDPARVEKSARQIQASIAQMQSLIRNLLDFARIQGGGLAMEPRLQDFGDAARPVIEMMRSQAEAKAQTLETDIPPGLPQAVFDRDRLGQVLSNLLGNAVKFTPRGGVIRLAAKAAAGGLEVSISDTGPGIASQDLPRIFERFWQAQGTRQLGAGLGLSIAKGIIEAHHGKIWVESEEGRGATFHFTIPFRESRLATAS